jgi:DNA-binding CsgD family transcriptional regulator
MPELPVRLAIASHDDVLVEGLRRMLGTQPHRVVVMPGAGVDGLGDGAVDVVLHDLPEPGRATENGVVWVPLEDGIELLLSLVESAAGIGANEHGLTEREAQVLDWIAQGMSNQEIAESAYVSINSVKTYIRSAYRKIGVKSRSQAVAWAVRRGYGASD